MKRKVVITGVGVVSPVGIGKEALWTSLSSGTSGIDYLSSFEPPHPSITIAAEVKGFKPTAFIEQRKALKVMSRDMQLAAGAAKLAMEDARFDSNNLDPTRIGVIVGSGMIHTDINTLGFAIKQSVAEDGTFDIKRFGVDGMQALFPLWLLTQLPNMIASHVSIFHNAQGPSNTITTSSCGGAQAVGEAFRIIERGDGDVMIAGGAESNIHLLKMLKYMLLKKLSLRECKPSEASCPFDRSRDGFVLGEGAGMVILEELSHARSRKAPIYAEVVGYGVSGGGEYRVEDHRLIAQVLQNSMVSALSDAQISSEKIEAISAYADSSIEADRGETVAIKEVFGERSYRIPITALKSMTGYMGAASPAVELIAAALTLVNGLLLPTINYRSPDPLCDLDYVPNAARPCSVNTILCNAWGFAGHSAGIVLKKYTES